MFAEVVRKLMELQLAERMMWKLQEQVGGWESLVFVGVKKLRELVAREGEWWWSVKEVAGCKPTLSELHFVSSCHVPGAILH